MTCSTLINTETLARHLDDPNWVLVDRRIDLASPTWGESEYAAAHIPGAVCAHPERGLAGPVGETTGRYPLPDPDGLVERLESCGIGPGTQVVAYDDSGGSMAERIWWLLRSLGHEAVALLDGVWSAWKEARLALDDLQPRPVAAHFIPRRTRP